MKLKSGTAFDDQVEELIGFCEVSRSQRIASSRWWKQLYLTGRVGGEDHSAAQYNKIYAHLDELESQLFSPADVRASIVYDDPPPDDVLQQAELAGSILSREMADRDLDLAFSHALTWGLVKGWCATKLRWDRFGLQAGIVQNEAFGVVNETITDLDKQEAFLHTTFLTPESLWRLIARRADAKSIMKDAMRAQQRTKDAEDETQDGSFFHQIVIGGIQPVATAGPTNPAGGIVSVIGSPIPLVSPQYRQKLIRFDELWVVDDEKQDYTTIQRVWPNHVIEGKIDRNNLFLQGVDLKGIHPFQDLTPLPIDGYFWGRSELQQIAPLQDLINKRLNDFERIWRKQARPPKKVLGVMGITEEKIRKLNAPDGWISDDNPNSKIEDMVPQLPQGAFDEFQAILGFFSDMAGMQDVMRGKGEPGVRAQSHAKTLLRSASSRIRDRALLVERKFEEFAQKCFQLMAAKKSGAVAEGTNQFYLSQLPPGFSVRIDSHTSSPAFADDARELAFALHERGAIDNEDLIMLTNPPHVDSLLRKAKARAAQQAQMAQQHPELLQAARGGKK